MRKCMPVPAALKRSLCSMERSRLSLSRSRRPMMLMRIDCSTQRRVSVNRYWPNRRISAATSRRRASPVGGGEGVDGQGVDCRARGDLDRGAHGLCAFDVARGARQPALRWPSGRFRP